MPNRFAENVKRIVGQDRPTTTDPALDIIGGIPSVRGIGTKSASGVISGGTVGKDEEKEKGDEGKTDNTTQSESQDTADDLNRADDGSSVRTPTAGEFEADDVIDGNDGPSPNDVEQNAFDGDPFSGSSSLTGLNMTDCDTGKDLNIRVDGNLKPIDATTYNDGAEKTPQWLDPHTPPEIIGFQLGFYWEVGGSGNPSPEQASTPDEAAELAAEYLDGASPSEAPHTIIGRSISTVDGGGNPTTYDFEYSRAISSDFTLPVSRIDCIATPPDDAGSCPAAAPTYTAWPDDNTISLYYSNGSFLASQYDNDATAEYLGQEQSRVNFCMDGGRFGALEAGKNGGVVLYETDTANGTATTGTIARYYNAQGELTAAFDATSGVINDYLPRPTD